MSETTNIPNPPAKARNLWQIPALAVGVLLFGGGLARMIATYDPLTFQEKCDQIDELEDGGAYTRAHAYVLHLLKEPELSVEEQAELFRRLVSITYQVEAPQRIHKRDNLDTITRSFRKAVHLGATPKPFDWYALGKAYLWLDRIDEAEHALRQALSDDVARADSVRRELVEMLMEPGVGLTVDLVRDVDAIIDDANSTSRNYLWAVDQKIRWLLANKRSEEATELAVSSRDRLAGTAEGPAIGYLEALCYRANGKVDEAEMTLRGLLRDWTVRDELWGRANWLLGMMHLEDGRPQAALNVFSDVMSSFVEGDIHGACQLGRAKALVALERYERSLDELSELTGDVREGRNRVVAPERLRELVRDTGEAVRSDKRLGLSIRYMELASTLIPKNETTLRAESIDEIASGYSRLAYLDDDGNEVTKPTVAFLLRAADMYEEAANLYTAEPPMAAAALANAAEQCDQAGATDRLINVLTRLVDGFPANENRAAAMLRLGMALQAEQQHATAVDVFDRLIDGYPRFPEALAARIPLAESLLKVDDVSSARGVKLLTDIVDDSGETTLFTPSATEYRQALFLLAEHLASATKAATPEDAEAFERRMGAAIRRLNDALGLYPDDSAASRLKFLRAEAYRRTAESMAARAETDDAMRREIEDRLGYALTDYQSVRDSLAAKDEPALTSLEKTYLRAAYLYIGDCLFDLGVTNDAIEAYREAAWRYENDPVAVSAALQVVHGFVRLGQRDESRAALGRLRWLLEKIPAETFADREGMSPKSYWLDLVDRMERMGV